MATMRLKMIIDHTDYKYEDEDEVQDDYNDDNVKLALDQCKR